jgi:hypothetical protein
MKNPDKYQVSAVCGMWRSGATMEEMCAASGMYWKVIKDIIDGYKEKIGHSSTHSTTTGDSFTCTTA